MIKKLPTVCIRKMGGHQIQIYAAECEQEAIVLSLQTKPHGMLTLIDGFDVTLSFSQPIKFNPICQINDLPSRAVIVTVCGLIYFLFISDVQ